MPEIRFGPYVLERRIAVGGMAEVFLAERVDTPQRKVVIKQILPQLAEDPELLQLFLDEARIASRVVHPGIVRVLDVGVVKGVHYLAMEHVEGLDLYQLHRSTLEEFGAFPRDVAVRVAIDLCRALEHVHEAKESDGTPLEILHRDVSPQNVLISREGAVKLTDFGIARARIRARRTRSGVLRGKMAYVSPEQFLGERGDRRIDVYAVGVILYELLTGQRPFTGDDAAIMREVTTRPAPRISTLVPGIDPALERIVHAALEREPSARVRSAGKLGDLLEGLGIAAPASRLRSLVDAALKRRARPEPARRARATETLSVRVEGNPVDAGIPSAEIAEITEVDDESGLRGATEEQPTASFLEDITVVSSEPRAEAVPPPRRRASLFDDAETIVAGSKVRAARVVRAVATRSATVARPLRRWTGLIAALVVSAFVFGFGYHRLRMSPGPVDLPRDEDLAPETYEPVGTSSGAEESAAPEPRPAPAESSARPLNVPPPPSPGVAPISAPVLPDAARGAMDGVPPAEKRAERSSASRRPHFRRPRPGADTSIR